jgi:hypothetical protein
MRVERAEAAGLGVALAAHVALLWALGLPRGPEPAPPPAMEVSFVDEAGLQSAAPTTEPAAASVAPELGAPEEAMAAAPETAPPEPLPPEPQRPIAQPVPRQAAPTPQPRRAAPAPAPQPRQAQQGTGRAQANRGARLGADILKGIGDDPVSRNPRPSGAVMSTQALADIGSMIRNQVRPCANRQRSPGPGAEQIRVTIRLRLNRDGSLAAPPVVIGRTGVDDSNSRYAERVDDLAINTFTACSPLRGLPAELYDVPNGWRNFSLRYNLPR